MAMASWSYRASYLCQVQNSWCSCTLRNFSWLSCTAGGPNVNTALVTAGASTSRPGGDGLHCTHVTAGSSGCRPCLWGSCSGSCDAAWVREAWGPPSAGQPCPIPHPFVPGSVLQHDLVRLLWILPLRSSPFWSSNDQSWKQYQWEGFSWPKQIHFVWFTNCVHICQQGKRWIASSGDSGGTGVSAEESVSKEEVLPWQLLLLQDLLSNNLLAKELIRTG
ncbi:uncharacterized protein LOC110401268 [Numida meleagris]|uniref:uncharacterized protein LOC110401268 n=1 Tax=Numida meleagris TaxID=8996 RepID=UPI000B3E4081|nr:uncharacterized protein LOC110401268 [Numida meleagris]